MNMLGLDADTFAGVNRFLRGETIAVMLFGSVARGDDSPISDTDILQLTSHYKPSYRVGRVSISVYTPESLEKIALKGSLFALHLKSEGRILYDPDLVLSRILDCYRPPCSYDPFLRELAYSLNLLNVSERVYREHFDAHNKVSLFLLRSILFALAAQSDCPTFSLEVAEARAGLEGVAELNSLKHVAEANYDLFTRCVRTSLKLLGAAFCYPHDAVESIVANAYGKNHLTVVLGLRLMGVTEPSGYAYGVT